MKNLLILILLTSYLNCIGQNKAEHLIEKTGQKIGIEKTDIYFRLATTKKFENGILIVIPEIAEKGNGYIIFNSNIILINGKTGDIKSKFRGKKDWYIDAVGISKIKIENKLYHLNKTTVGYGLQIFYSGQSKPNPYYATQLSIYAQQGDDFNQVLKDYPIKIFNGETDTTCKGKFEEHFKKIDITNNQTNNYLNLKFTDSIEISKRNKKCEKTILETKSNIEILKYKNGEYKNVL